MQHGLTTSRLRLSDVLRFVACKTILDDKSDKMPCNIERTLCNVKLRTLQAKNAASPLPRLYRNRMRDESGPVKLQMLLTVDFPDASLVFSHFTLWTVTNHPAWTWRNPKTPTQVKYMDEWRVAAGRWRGRRKFGLFSHAIQAWPNVPGLHFRT